MSGMNNEAYKSINEIWKNEMLNQAARLRSNANQLRTKAAKDLAIAEHAQEEADNIEGAIYRAEKNLAGKFNFTADRAEAER